MNISEEIRDIVVKRVNQRVWTSVSSSVWNSTNLLTSNTVWHEMWGFVDVPLKRSVSSTINNSISDYEY